MKANEVKVTSGNAPSEVVLVLRRRKFPWWILLLLIPLIFLIPIPRSINVQFLEAASSSVLPNTPASVSYYKVSTFGSRQYIDVRRNTDSEGILRVDDIHEPLWHVLFADNDSVVSICQNGCAGAHDVSPYNKVVKESIHEVRLASAETSLQVIVVDRDSNEPLPDASVVVLQGESGAICNASSSESGEALLNGLPMCSSIMIVASRDGFHNDTLRGNAQDLAGKPVSDRTLRLVPLKGTVKVLVKDLKTKNPLPNATVTMLIEGSQQTLRTNTNGVGLGVFDDVRLSATISFQASKQGYADTTKQGGTVRQFVQLSDEQRTIYMRQLPKPTPPPPPPPPHVPDPPIDNPVGQKGDLRFNLQWHCKADLDIYVKDPCGKITGCRSKRTSCSGSVGTLDVDANQNATNEPWKAKTNPQENVFWQNPSNGQYKVMIVCCPFHPLMNLKKRTIDFSLVIEDRNGRIVKQGSIAENDSIVFITHTLR
ncbi:MAG: carboxypeptidase-like regulatory domain-containing protein [Bacteroidales bacterium]|nr:carboxypeptidase-like regulatory domain-containing protein [Bacteroidales bacterium]